MNKSNDIERIGTGEDAERPVPIQSSQIGTGWDEEDKADEGFRSRLKSLVGEHGSIAALARLCGIGESTLRKWVDGPSEPNRARLVSIARGAGVSLVWLATGEGPRERDPGALKPDKHGIPEPRLTAAQLAKMPPSLVERSDFRQMFLVAYAIKAVANDLSMSDQEELGRRMVGALVVASDPDGDTSHLDVTDMQALASIIRKLLPPSQ